MSLRLITLGSGSAGNASVVTDGTTSVLIDAGIAARTLTARLEAAEIAPASLHAILLTHEHGDHTSGLQNFTKKQPLPIFANPPTAHVLKSGVMGDYPHWNLFETGSRFAIGSISVDTFPVPHDAADPVGFVLESGGISIGILTDLGYSTNLVVERIRGVSTLYIEANHDAKLLQEDLKRPWSVKQRILSRHGHLSNDAAAQLVLQAAGHQLSCVVAGHLSRDCNSVNLVEEAFRRVLTSGGLGHIRVVCAPPDAVMRF